MAYCVYVFLDHLDRPYYVGKTSDILRRRTEHLIEAKKGNPLPKYNAIRTLLKKGYKFRMKTIKKSFSEKEAYRLERYYIRKFIAEGYLLYNCTYGGPEEKPMRIKKPKRINTKGLAFPEFKKREKVKIKLSKLTKR